MNDASGAGQLSSKRTEQSCEFYLVTMDSPIHDGCIRKDSPWTARTAFDDMICKLRRECKGNPKCPEGSVFTVVLSGYIRTSNNIAILNTHQEKITK